MSEFDGLLKALNEGMSSPDYRDSVNAAGDFALILKKHVEEAAAEYMTHSGQEVDTGPDSSFVENLMLDLPDILQGAFNEMPAVAEVAPKEEEGAPEDVEDDWENIMNTVEDKHKFLHLVNFINDIQQGGFGGWVEAEHHLAGKSVARLISLLSFEGKEEVINAVKTVYSQGRYDEDEDFPEEDEVADQYLDNLITALAVKLGVGSSRDGEVV